MRVGRGSDDKVLPKRLGRSSNAKTAHNAKKANEDRRTDIPTDQQTARAGCRVACTRLKNRECVQIGMKRKEGKREGKRERERNRERKVGDRD